MCLFCDCFFLAITNIQAYQFKFSEFDWDKFYEEKKSFWEDLCKTEDGGTDKKCEYELANAQKKFYKKLYKALAKYEKKESSSLELMNMNILMTLF